MKFNSQVKLIGNRVQIIKVTGKDGGLYLCQYENKIGRSIHSMKLIIEGFKFDKQSRYVYVFK